MHVSCDRSNSRTQLSVQTVYPLSLLYESQFSIMLLFHEASLLDVMNTHETICVVRDEDTCRIPYG